MSSKPWPAYIMYAIAFVCIILAAGTDDRYTQMVIELGVQNAGPDPWHSELQLIGIAAVCVVMGVLIHCRLSRLVRLANSERFIRRSSQG